jgi:hypothetical protein
MKINDIKKLINFVQIKKIVLNSSNLIKDLFENANPNSIVKKTDPLHIENLGKKYDKLQKKLQHKFAIYEFNKLAKLINTNKKITGRLILSAFAFAGYPEFTLDIYRYELEELEEQITIREKLYLLSKKIIYGLKNITTLHSFEINIKEIMKLREHIILYQYYQSLYLSIDRQNKVQELLLRWYNEETQIDLVEKNNDIDDKSKSHIIYYSKKQQNKTINILKLIDSSIDEQFLSLYKDIIENVRKTYIKVFWDGIDVSFKKGSSESFINIINEMIEKLKILIPFKKRESVYKEIDENIDIEFIKCKIDSELFNECDIKNICDIFVKYLCSVCSSAMREKIVMMYKDIVEKEYDSCDERYKTYIKFILDQLNNVNEDIEVIKFALSNGINIFV